MNNINELEYQTSEQNRLRALVWPGVMLASLTMYWWLINSLGMSYDTAIQLHFVGLLIGIFILELLIPFHEIWNKYDRQGWNDFIYNITFPAAQIIATSLALWIVGQQATGTKGNLFDLDLHFILQLGILVLIVDLIWYICHRAFHTIPFLWKLHALHHSSDQLHVLNNARVHPLEVFVFFLPIMLVVLFIDVPIGLLNWYFAFQLTVGLLTHSNVAVKSGWLSLIINTPELHHWHHSKIRKEHDNNYSSVSIFWDHIFGTYFNPKNREASADIGVGAGNYIPESWFKQLLIPLTKNKPKKKSNP